MIDPIEQLKTTSIDNLRKPVFLLDLVRSWGLHNDPNVTHLYGEHNQDYLVTQGMLQVPEQLTDALIYLSDKDIKTYIEIGTFNGMATTFITAYLMRFRLESTLTVDNLREYLHDYNLPIRQVIGTSDDIKGTKSDLCFIDGDHSLEWTTRDYENVGRHARLCMIHDILETGMIRTGKMESSVFWNKYKRPESVEFTTGGRLGIGIL